MIQPSYYATFHNTLDDDYKRLHYTEFWSNYANIGGKLEHVVQMRNEYLNRPATDYNKAEQRLGKKLATKNMIKQFEERNKQHLAGLYQSRVEYHNSDYEKYLLEKKEKASAMEERQNDVDYTRAKNRIMEQNKLELSRR